MYCFVISLSRNIFLKNNLIKLGRFEHIVTLTQTLLLHLVVSCPDPTPHEGGVWA